MTDIQLPARVLKALVGSGLAPPRSFPSPASPGVAAGATAGVDLLPALVTAWGRKVHDAGVRPARRRDWLEQARQNGARLTIGVPRPASDLPDTWLGPRLYWWPWGVPSRRLVGLASSRLGRAVEQQNEWFRALRAACLEHDPARDQLLIGAGTAPRRFALRAAELFGVPVTELRVSRRDGLVRWLQVVADWRWERPRCSPAMPCLVSPPLGVTSGGSELGQVPACDEAVFALADELRILRVRPAGSIHRLALARLQQHPRPVGGVRLAVGRQLVADAVRDELLGQGAVGWVLLEAATPGPVEKARTVDPAGPSALRRVSSAVVFDGALPGTDFLTHCTRRRDGPWPGEAEEAYLDELILSRHAGNRSPLAALGRILIEMRLTASRAGIRGGYPVVSFTNVRLGGLHRLRVFRPHRGRWDFQPYGISIRRSWLALRGTRPVEYAAVARWDTLPAAERPFFQVDHSTTATGREIDWSAEQEWRHVGDVDLTQVPREDAYVFVPSAAEAARLTPISRWPVLILPPSAS